MHLQCQASIVDMSNQDQVPDGYAQVQAAFNRCLLVYQCPAQCPVARYPVSEAKLNIVYPHHAKTCNVQPLSASPATQGRLKPPHVSDDLSQIAQHASSL